MPESVRTLGLAAAVLVAMTGSAFAHAHLKSAIPAAQETLSASPKELALHFTEGVNLSFTGVAVTGPGNAAVATGAAKLDPTNDAMLIVPLSASLPAGTYTVNWHALAVDGHKTTGRYSFTVKAQ
jgi:methionine-rich copper-binding protein CopC